MNVNTDPGFWNWVLDGCTVEDICEDCGINEEDLLNAFYDRIFSSYHLIYEHMPHRDDDES